MQAVSNVEDLQQAFEDNGVRKVSQYRTVDADWIVTNENGDEVTIHIQEAILKCDELVCRLCAASRRDKWNRLAGGCGRRTDIGVGWCGYSRRYSTAG